MAGAFVAVDDHGIHTERLRLQRVLHAGGLVHDLGAGLLQRVEVFRGAAAGGLDHRYAFFTDHAHEAFDVDTRVRGQQREVDAEWLRSERARALDFAPKRFGSGCVCAEMMPRPPALETAAASSARDTQRMPLCTMGSATPSSSVARVFMSCHRRQEAAAVVVHHAARLLGREGLAGFVGEFTRRRHTFACG
jgi:hypothetical protein